LQGSGKTLAFGLPILQQLIQSRKGLLRSEEQTQRVLRCLILLPTRELAIQICEHLCQVSKFTNIKIVSLVGGISVPKQQRLLLARPEIVVATPGRLWELISGPVCSDYLRDFSGLQFFVLDEADRMIQHGHYEQLYSILKLLSQKSQSKKYKDDESHSFCSGETDFPSVEAIERSSKPTSVLQTFVFSATLTFEIKESYRGGRKPKKNQERHNLVLGTKESHLDRILSIIEFQRKIALLDITTKLHVAHLLSEWKVECISEEKDLYLYYAISVHPARTLIFVNSVACIRRLLSLLEVLHLPVFGLHARMQQRQRLRNLERFQSASPNSILVATDVAARGLDIPDIEYVIHYQLPRNAELYVHRSGRTARANRSGMSVLLVAPEDRLAFQKLCSTLKSGTEEHLISNLKIDSTHIPLLRRKIMLAKEIEHLLYEIGKVTMVVY